MGSLLSSAISAVSSADISAGQKRCLQELDDGDGSDGEFDRLLNTPKRRKMMSTMAYVYETMFKNGEGSDVTLHALGRRWRLHKLYLSQSPYFKSMFSENWREARENDIRIEIVDPNITMAGLETALGSLYHDEVELQPSDIVSVVAAAALFQLDGLLVQCGEVMRSCINVQTAVVFLEAATSYSLLPVQQCCQVWLENNLLTHVNEHHAVLRQLSPQVLATLVSSPTLLVHQTEFSVYVVLKLWLFLRLKPEWSGAPGGSVLAAHKYFQQRKGSVTVLDTDEAAHLAEPFRRLRLPHLIMHPLDTEVLLSDRILPKQWMHGLFRHQWLTLLKLDQGTTVPGWSADVTEEQFDACALRCGRTLKDRHRCTWRWTGFNFGLDLVLVHQRRQIFLRRMQRQDMFPLLISQAAERDVIYRIRVISLDDQRMSKHTQTTGLVKVRLARDQEIRIATLDQEATYPLLLSSSVMVAPEPYNGGDT